VRATRRAGFSWQGMCKHEKSSKIFVVTTRTVAKTASTQVIKNVFSALKGFQFNLTFI